MPSIEIVDRSSMLEKPYQGLLLDPAETAIVTIDMHRGHLDPAVATMPTSAEDAKRVIANARELLSFARSQGVPVIHVKLVFRRIPGIGSEGMTSPFWRALHELTREEDRLTPNRRSTEEGFLDSLNNVRPSPGRENARFGMTT
jgi:hypothetical protein